jgi:hypothetical protein
MRRTLLLFTVVITALAVTTAAAPEHQAAGHPTSRPNLRQPGFIFLELETPKVEQYAEFFGHVADFQIVSRQHAYIEMESSCGQLILIDPSQISKGHPFHDKVKGDANGIGVEIGIVVADLDKAHTSALKQPGWRMSTGIVKRPWGVRDCRVLSPDGYYLRFTEGGT